VLNSVSASPGTPISSKSMIYLLEDRDQVGQTAIRKVGFSMCAVLIGRTGFGTISSIPQTRSDTELNTMSGHPDDLVPAKSSPSLVPSSGEHPRNPGMIQFSAKLSPVCAFSIACRQGLALGHLSAQLKRYLWDWGGV